MNNNKKNIILIIILSCCCSIVWGDKKAYVIKFGILDRSPAGIFVSKETNEIPYITKKQGQVFGFKITPPNEKKYSYYTVSTLPSAPKIIDGAVREGTKKNIFTSPLFHNKKGAQFHLIWLNEGDPRGIYRTEIYINNKLEKTIRYEVTKVM